MVEAVPFVLRERVEELRWEPSPQPAGHRREARVDLQDLPRDPGQAEVDETAEGAVDLGVTPGAGADPQRRTELDEIDADPSRLVVETVSDTAGSDRSLGRHPVEFRDGRARCVLREDVNDVEKDELGGLDRQDRSTMPIRLQVITPSTAPTLTDGLATAVVRVLREAAAVPYAPTHGSACHTEDLAS